MHRSTAAAVAALLVSVPLMAACSGAADQSAPSSSAASSGPTSPPATPSAESSPEADDGAAASDLPEDWPDGLPAYEGGRILSISISDDGLNVNAAWASDETAEDAWATMDAALRERGLTLTSEAGGEDMLVQDETMRSDYYVGGGFEANLVVLPGEQTTVLLNASQL